MFAGPERREFPRIIWHFVLRAKPYAQGEAGPPAAGTANWEISAVQNISRGGCSFFSNFPYKPGDLLDIGIQFPSCPDLIRFLGEVRHCHPRVSGISSTYYLGVKFMEIDEAKKGLFYQSLDFFLKKGQRS
jgi:hypothetical protein